MRTSFCHRQIWDPRRQCVVFVRARAAPAFPLAPLRHGDMHTINRLVSFNALLSSVCLTPGLRSRTTSDSRGRLGYERTSGYERLPGKTGLRERFFYLFSCLVGGCAGHASFVCFLLFAFLSLCAETGQRGGEDGRTFLVLFNARSTPR